MPSLYEIEMKIENLTGNVGYTNNLLEKRNELLKEILTEIRIKR